MKLKITKQPSIDEEESYGDPTCGNMLISVGVKGKYNRITLDCDVTIDARKDYSKLEIPCDYIYGDWTLDMEDEEEQGFYFSDGDGWKETSRYIISLIPEEQLRKIIDHQVKLDKEVPPEDICEYCGEEMEWEMDFENAQWTKGGSMINLDDCIENGGYTCGNEDCYESH